MPDLVTRNHHAVAADKELRDTAEHLVAIQQLSPVRSERLTELQEQLAILRFQIAIETGLTR